MVRLKQYASDGRGDSRLPMTKATAMYQQGGPAHRGISQIPQPAYRKGENSFSSGYSSQSSASKQSRLELLQADYQRKLLKEKEEKMLHMYEDNQKRAIDKVGGNSRQADAGAGRGVRKFFNERRALAEQSSKCGVPPIHQHYSQYQQQSSQNGHTTMQKAYSSRSAPQPYRHDRHSAGRDRANPLAPIDKRGGYCSPSSIKSDQPPQRRAPMPPIQQKPRIYQRKPGPGQDRNGNKVYQGQIYAGSNSAPNNMGGNDDYGDDEEVPSSDLRNLKVIRHKRPSKRDSESDQTSMLSKCENPQKLTDFQKWQLEQDKAREERLEKRRQQHQSGSNRSGYSSERDEHDSGADVNEEIRRKQEELQARLESQKVDLRRIQVEREREEEKEKQKKARQERAQAAERERQKRQEEKRQKQKEAEQERKRRQEERRHEEEERRHAEEDRRRDSRQSGVTFDHYSDGDEASPRYKPPPRKTPVRSTKPPAARRTVNPPQRRSPSPQQDEDDYIVPGPSVDIYAQAANDSEAFGGKIDLAACKVCGRRFAKDRLAKHQSACKIAAKPRKVFDPVKMRTAGTEQAQYVRGNMHQREPPKTKKKANWRAQHESFVESIRYAKKMTQYEAEGKNIADLPPPPPSDTSDYVQCPHCNRKFNALVADRHIPKCVNIRAKPRPPPGKRR